MHDLYTFVTGPAAWISFLLFLSLMIFKITKLVKLTAKKDPQVLRFFNFKLSICSLFRWITPYATASSRQHPVVTFVNTVFHLLLLVTPLFLLSHVVLIEQYFGIKWMALPDRVADIMTVAVVAGCLFLAVRRFVKPEVRFVTSFSDWMLLFMIALPFVTGFLAYHQLFNYKAMLILHIVSAEVLLVAIPLTRLSHMFYAIFTRSYTASEFGMVRYARDW